jgi:uridine kinase
MSASPEDANAEMIGRLLAAWQARRPARRHLTIGIGGGSASGKTTIARQIAQELCPLRTDLVRQDAFYLPVEELPTYDSEAHGCPRPDWNRPDSFDFEALWCRCTTVSEVDVLIIEGILVLHYPQLRDLMDVKCYVEADSDERVIRRVRRNIARWPLEEIGTYYIESVRHQHERYNAPSREHADLVIPGGMADTDERNAILTSLCSCILKAFES